MAKKRKKQDTSGDSGADSTPPAKKRVETVRIDGDGDDYADFMEARRSPGATVDEGATEIERLMSEGKIDIGEMGDNADALAAELKRYADGTDEHRDLRDDPLDPNDFPEEGDEFPDPVESEGDEDMGDRPRHEWSEEELDALVTVGTVQGEEVTVPLREALQGYQRQSDYTKKTQALAEQRREAESLRDDAATMAQSYANQLEIITMYLGRALPEDTRQVLAQSYSRAVQDARAANAQALQERLASEHEALTEAMGWHSDEDVKAGKRKLVEGATEYFGFEPHELSNLQDHRALVALDKAIRYEELQRKVDEAKPRKPGRTLKPGHRAQKGGKRSRSRKEHARARKKLAETGSLDAAAAAILTLPDVGGR